MNGFAYSHYTLTAKREFLFLIPTQMSRSGRDNVKGTLDRRVLLTAGPT